MTRLWTSRIDFLLSGKASESTVVVRLRVGLAGRRRSSRADAWRLRGLVGLSNVDSSKGVDSVAALCVCPLASPDSNLLTGAWDDRGREDWRRVALDCRRSCWHDVSLVAFALSSWE